MPRGRVAFESAASPERPDLDLPRIPGLSLGVPDLPETAPSAAAAHLRTAESSESLAGDAPEIFVQHDESDERRPSISAKRGEFASGFDAWDAASHDDTHSVLVADETTSTGAERSGDADADDERDDALTLVSTPVALAMRLGTMAPLLAPAPMSPGVSLSPTSFRRFSNDSDSSVSSVAMSETSEIVELAHDGASFIAAAARAAAITQPNGGGMLHRRGSMSPRLAVASAASLFEASNAHALAPHRLQRMPSASALNAADAQSVLTSGSDVTGSFDGLSAAGLSDIDRDRKSVV